MTDHKPLHDLKKNRKPDEQLGRLMLKLQGLNHQITYVPGKKNKTADLLSRDTTPATNDHNDIEIEMRAPDVLFESGRKSDSTPINNNRSNRSAFKQSNRTNSPISHSSRT